MLCYVIVKNSIFETCDEATYIQGMLMLWNHHDFPGKQFSMMSMKHCRCHDPKWVATSSKSEQGAEMVLTIPQCTAQLHGHRGLPS